jgi:hypothetical protein
MKLRIKPLSIMHPSMNIKCHSVEHYAESRIFIVTLVVILSNVVVPFFFFRKA